MLVSYAASLKMEVMHYSEMSAEFQTARIHYTPREDSDYTANNQHHHIFIPKLAF
jgi:hypothetical protein